MGKPALSPWMPACFKPFFLIMKLEPMNMDELTARAKPFAWSVDHRLPCRDPRSTPAARMFVWCPLWPHQSLYEAAAVSIEWQAMVLRDMEELQEQGTPVSWHFFGLVLDALLRTAQRIRRLRGDVIILESLAF